MPTYPPSDANDHEPPKRASTLRTSFIREAIIRYRGRRIGVEDPIREPRQAIDLARRVVHDHAREHFVAIYLDGRHRAIAHSVVSVGTATASLVHPREVFQAAVLSGAVAFLILHNHPSGDPSPSREDREITERLRDAGKILGITLLDSIVWTHERRAHVSLREQEPAAFS